MQYFSSRKFDKQFAKLQKKLQDQFIQRVEIFIKNPYDDILNNHRVHYPYEGCRSINISGDIRALYEMNNNTATFIHIGSHSELYK